ncbi:homoserine kinase [Peribacillus tepidiphilus]|uniref:homoserine kinase n=1 Tax=Peribacillus tepidiphilus TaxID=2652445 RepID=UPI0012919088|nr:homoserine kinase [Peribacillus tepidiphilus]
MSEEKMYSIRVPASTANLGPGFDSIGLALSLYLTVDVYKSDKWEVIPVSKELEVFPRDESHYICKIAKKTASLYGKEMSPCKLYVTSDIPLTRGLGSSASAIVAGIELANVMCDLGLSQEEKVHLSSLEEGHPDNAGASVKGGLVVGEHNERETNLLSFKLPSIEIVALIPNYELYTEDSRNVLPSVLSYSESVKASAIANTFLAALLSGNWELAGKMMSEDRFHQPYRKKLVPHIEDTEEIAKQAGAFGVALSGAGPTVVCFSEKKHTENVRKALSEVFPEYESIKLEIDYDGSTVTAYSVESNGEIIQSK